MRTIADWIQGFDYSALITLLLSVIAAVSAISIHECSHGLMAYWLGDDTAKRQGRVSLNPFRHVDWVGFVMLAVFHFGWARPVQVDMRRFKHPKSGMALTALAGPLSNLLLALLAGLIGKVLGGVYLLSPTAGSENWLYYLYLLFMYIQGINIGLAIFNLFPIPPLDGSKVLAVFLPDRLHGKLMQYERYGMLLLVALLFTGVLDTPLDFLFGVAETAMDVVLLPAAQWILELIY